MPFPTPSRQLLIVFEKFAALFLWLALSSSGLLMGRTASAQSTTFAANAQHTGFYQTPAQHLDRIRWSTSVNLANNGSYAHYGAPLITASNTVVVPVRTASGFQVSAFDGATGRLKYTLPTDYVLPTYNWLPVYQPVLVGTNDTRLYFAGAGGSLFYVENPDSDAPSVPVRECFYTDLVTFTNNLFAFTATVFVNTPITSDPNGAVFFGFRVPTNGAPAPLSTTNGGYARIDPAGNASFVRAGVAAANNLVSRDSHNCAPAVSNDGSTVYVAVKDPPYLLGLDATNLTTKYRVRLNAGSVPDDSTASPVVAPDNDVFFGTYGGGGRGLLLHFSPDLTQEKTPGGFGWDYTPALVPASMVPTYQGTSTYLIFCKYNNYAGGGDGINRIALLDPGATEVSPLPGGLTEMREVFSVIGCTPDAEYLGSRYPYAVREWCINTAAVNPATQSIFAPSEDGRFYRWDLGANSLSESIQLGSGVGEPYVPTVIGPDGAIYTLNGGKLFAIESNTNVVVSLSSSVPDLRNVVCGQQLAFTATVKNPNPTGPQPTGSVIFQDVTFFGLTPATNVLDTVPLVAGIAILTTSNLFAGSNCLGSHFVTAAYTGDASFNVSTTTLIQKVHAFASAITLSASRGSGAAVSLTAAVSPAPPSTGRPTGLVSFWQQSAFLGQRPLSTNGVAVMTSTNLTPGLTNISAFYCSDTVFASAAAKLLPSPRLISVSILSGGAVQLLFSSLVSGPFTVLCAADPTLPLDQWSELGTPIETSPGQFQFVDADAMNHSQRFYSVRSP